MTKRPDKRAVLAALITEVQRSLDVMIEAAKIAHAAATHEEMKPENDKDTRGLEAGYLARGQSQRAAAIEATLKQLRVFAVRAWKNDEPIDTGALVELDTKARVFIAPGGGGVKLKVDGLDVQVVTLTSPLGEALEGKRVGDIAELNKRALEIVSVT